MFEKHLTVGLDVGGYSLKCAAVEAKSGFISGLWKAEVQACHKSNEKPLNSFELSECLGSFLRTCQKECRIYGYKVNTAIQGTGTISRYIELPSFTKELTEAELRTAVFSQVSKYVPFPLEEVTLSYCKVPSVDYDEKKVAIFFVAAQKSLVEKQMKLLQGLGLHIERVEVPQVGLARELARNHELPKDQFFALVHSGYAVTELMILRDGYPYFTKEFSLAGRDFTYVFQMSAQSTWEEAEQSKFAYDTMERKPFIEPFLNRWLNEIKDGVTCFSKQFSAPPLSALPLTGSARSSTNIPLVQKIFFSGGTASWKNMDRRLAEHMGVSVTVDGWDRIKCEKCDKNGAGNGQPGVYKVAVGLALER